MRQLYFHRLQNLQNEQNNYFFHHKRYNEPMSIDNADKIGHKKGSTYKKLNQKVIKSLMENNGLSLNDQAKKFKISNQ